MPLAVTYTFSPGATIFASEHNTNFNDVENWANTHETLNSSVHGITGNFVDTGSIQTITAAKTFGAITTFNQAVNMLSPAYISNARLSLSAGVLSLLGENGSAPSASNPIYIRRISSSGATAGKWETITITSSANCVIQDASSVDSYFYNGVTGTPWGTTSGRSWPDAMPLFIYMATDGAGANPCLFLSRVPNMKTLPIAARIGYANNPPVAAAESNVFAWTTSNVTASHAAQPCILIGFVEATKNTNNDWTFQALTSSTGGINNTAFNGKIYNMPTGQNGADVGTFFSTSAGTAPTYPFSSVFKYCIFSSGLVACKVSVTESGGGTPGAGAGALALSAPLKNSIQFLISGSASVTNGASLWNCNLLEITTLLYMSLCTATTATSITGADQNNASRSMVVNFSYMI